MAQILRYYMRTKYRVGDRVMNRQIAALVGKLVLVVVVLLVPSRPTLAQPVGRNSGSGHLYCSTSNPLGVAYIDLAAGQEKRLFRDAVGTLLAGPHRWIAALRYVQHGQRIEVLGDGRLVRQHNLSGNQNNLVGWANHALLFKTPAGMHTLEVATGSKCRVKHLDDIVDAHPVGRHWVAVTRSDNVYTVQTRCGLSDELVYAWQSEVPGRVWDSTTIGARYFVLWTRDYEEEVGYTGDNILVFDLAERSQIEIVLRDRCAGISPGRSEHELLVASEKSTEAGQKANVKVEAISLPEMSRKALVTMQVPLTSLIGPTSDGKWLIMYMVYPDYGPGRPGKVFAVRLSDAYRRDVRENVYECRAMP